MISHLKSKRNGRSMNEFIEGRLERADEEFDSLDTIIANAKDEFSPTHDQLVEIVRHCIHRLVDAGARPFTDDSIGSPPEFHPTDKWGTTRDEITEAIIADWQDHPIGELDWGRYPFAFVEKYYPDGWPEPANVQR